MILYAVEISFKDKGRIKAFSERGKLENPLPADLQLYVL